MATIITRETGATAKNSPLTNAELDANFVSLNTAKLEIADLVAGRNVDVITASGKTTVSSKGTVDFDSLTSTSIFTPSLNADNSVLNGINSAALHRSPNAVTAMFVYDTSKDSDGGAWTEKCQHTSWYNEAINGKWLGAQASEAAARAVSGATTGDYFQLTTDGKFYKLNAISGTTEVFRGNKREFPRMSAVVLEALSVTIYDLIEPGRPMWMRFEGEDYAFLYTNVWPNACMAIGQGQLWVGRNADVQISHPVVADFAKDQMTQYVANTSQAIKPVQGIAHRNSPTLGFTRYHSQIGSINSIKVPGPSFQNGMANSFAITVLTGAPIDHDTGLQLPTVAMGTKGGLYVWHHSGALYSRSPVSHDNSVFATAFDEFGGLSYVAGGDHYFYTANVKNLALANGNQGADEKYYRVPGGAASAWPGLGAIPSGYSKHSMLKETAFGTIFGLSRSKENTLNKPITCYTNNKHTTGWLGYDTRRAYLSDVDVGSVSGIELVTNGTFDTDTTGWSSVQSGVLSVDANRLLITNGNFGGATQGITVVPGKAYVVTGTYTAGTAVTGRVVAYYGNQNGTAVQKDVTTGPFFMAFVGQGASCSLTLTVLSGTAGVTGYFDNISVKEASHDRSYKAQGAPITGTLTKSTVATAAQLVAYSGFSAANYLRELYSADLDFGTGEWSVSAWVSIPTANAAAGTIASRAHSSGSYITLGIYATNKLTATVSDGTTTCTVTTPAAYNTASWVKAEACYTTDGTLSIRVNGQQVAATYGAPLLTLNNANAVLTIGNSYALDAPFPGSIALLKLGATVPTAEQSVWMYEQEKQMFREGAQVCLPDTNAIADLAYDEVTDKWIAVSSTNMSEWSGLVRTNVTAAPSGSYSKLASAGGVTLQGRSTTNPGVDITIPAYGLRKELAKRAESAAKLNAQLVPFYYLGGFTANTTSLGYTGTSVTSLLYPVSYAGALVSSTSLQADTTIVSVNGTTVYFNKSATGSITAAQISFRDFILPVGYEAKAVLVEGVLKSEGSTADYTRLFDGFKETIRFAVAPGYSAKVQIQAVRSAT